MQLPVVRNAEIQSVPCLQEHSSSTFETAQKDILTRGKGFFWLLQQGSGAWLNAVSLWACCSVDLRLGTVIMHQYKHCGRSRMLCNTWTISCVTAVNEDITNMLQLIPLSTRALTSAKIPSWLEPGGMSIDLMLMEQML